MKKTTKNHKSSQKNNNPGILRRLSAMLYDWLLCLACLFVFTGIAVTLNQGNALSDKQQPFLNAGLIGVVLVYFIGFWRQGGQTPGMKVWKIHIMADEPPARVDKLIIRFFVVLLTLGLAIIPMFFRKDNKGLHDILSKTSLKMMGG